MKQVVQNYKSGELALLDVPVPGCKPGGVLVRSAYSLISTGTELMKVSEAGMSMVGKARSRPDQVAKVVQSVAANGVPATYRKVMGKLDSYTPLGYSLCGVVEQVGAGIDDVKVGDLVACAGNEHAPVGCQEIARRSPRAGPHTSAHDDQKSNCTLNRMNRGSSTAVGCIHRAPFVAGS